MERLAIIGTGISGLGAAYLLNKKFEITLFEKNNYIGGHTNTIEVKENNHNVSFDTGFMVFNKVTYPNLLRLFDELNVDYKPTDMSFSVQHRESGLEYCGSGLSGLFGQRKNIFNFSFIKMLLNINAFNKKSIKILEDPLYDRLTIKEFVEKENYSKDFLNKYLVPMSSAVWSTPPDKMMDFPAKTLIRFFYNHGFLGLNTQHQWYTVTNGSKNYVNKIIEKLDGKISKSNAVTEVHRQGEKVKLIFSDDSSEVFDKVLFATHADQALDLIKKPTAIEQYILGKFSYQKNPAVVHTDSNLMPENKNVWSSWNYKIDKIGEEVKTSTIYWMNRLQGVSDDVNYFVSIDDPGLIDKSKIIREIEYEHPLFSIEAVTAQKKIFELNTQNNNTFFCGSYFKYGFHEDAFASAINASNIIAGEKIW